MGSITFLVMHSGRWNEDNCYVDYNIEAIVIKEYATFRELLDVVSKQICVDLSFNSVKLRYKIEGSNAPLEIHNDMGVRVYVSLKKDNKELAKYPLCVSVFVNDCELADRNILEDGFGMCGIDGEDIVDTQALVLSVPNNNDYMNCDIITNTKHKVVLEDQVYKDKETLKSVMTQYAIEHRFQWRTDRSSQTCYTLVCVSEKCGWMLKSSSINKSGMFRIRKFVDEHTCPLKDKVYEHRQATSNLIGGMIQPKLVDHKRKLTPKDIQQDVSLALGVDVSYAVAWKAKEKAVISLRGTPSGSYSKLPSYLYILDTTYPGSHIRMKKTD